VIARGVFSSVKDLAKKLMRYIRLYNRQAKPVKWTYKNARNFRADASKTFFGIGLVFL